VSSPSEELKRRTVIRVSAAYLVVGWALIEVSDTIFPRLGLPGPPAWASLGISLAAWGPAPDASR
jgi:hypothetical protein